MTPSPAPSLYNRGLRSLLFRLDAERAHDLAVLAARCAASNAWLRRLLFGRLHYASERLPVSIAGLRAAAPLGVAAGLDKQGTLYPFLAQCGFGHVESGTFTALAQRGNPRPRLFRFAEREAIVNRMGFNNPGAARAAAVIRRQERSVPRGISLGKSRVAQDPVADLRDALQPLAPLADYLAINVSSPNTPGVRALQTETALRALFRVVREVAPQRPLFLKLAPDLAEADFDRLVDVAEELEAAALVLTNTTLSRRGVPEAANVEGGLSGAPLREISTAWIRRAFRRTSGRLPIVGVGGIVAVEHAIEKIRAGATWLQAYSGFVYRGPSFASELHRELDGRLAAQRATLTQWIGSDA